MTDFRVRILFVLAVSLLAGACSSSPSDDPAAGVAEAMQQSMKADLTALWTAANDLQAAAPIGHGWDAAGDAAAIAQMKTAWVRARTAYEHVEGAIAPIFPDVDQAIDQRYDGFLQGGNASDTNLFDDRGVTGMHAIERILYSETIPPRVVAFEMKLAGYQPAAFPSNEQEASDFKSKLCVRFVTDTKILLDSWTPLKIEVADAFTGLIGLVEEQKEKVSNAQSDTEESRYSQRTMADLRANLDGTTSIYGLFRGWVQSRPATSTSRSGASVDTSISAGLQQLTLAYDAVRGDSIPAPPATWSAVTPSMADLQTSFGRLYTTVARAADDKDVESLVSQMKDAAVLLGIPGVQ